MGLVSKLEKLATYPWSLSTLFLLNRASRGSRYSRAFRPAAPSREQVNSQRPLPSPDNRLASFFEAHESGRGILKWRHYFDIYDRHFKPFVGRDINIVEIGVYSGGSLDMWQSYFGDRCHVHGVDINPSCRAYETDKISIHIGDQADRGFWRSFKQRVGPVDIVIDDGGHEPEQQIVSLEEMLPQMKPGGVYLCEDVHGAWNSFAYFMCGLANQLNVITEPSKNPLKCSQFQSYIRGVYFYPFVVIVEKNDEKVATLESISKGSEWQPVPE